MQYSRKEVDKIIRDRCKQEGYIKRGEWYIRESKENDFQELLIFNHTLYAKGKSMAVSVFAGIGHGIVKSLFEQMTGYISKEPLSIITVNLGYLSPLEYFKDWYLTSDSDCEKEINEIFKYIHDYAIPFYRNNKNFNQLITLYENKGLTVTYENMFYMLPLMYLVLNQKDKGIRLLNDMIRNGFKVDDFKQKFIDRYHLYQNALNE